MLPSKLDWFLSTMEAFWGEKMGAYRFSMRFGILRESKYVVAPLLRFTEDFTSRGNF